MLQTIHLPRQNWNPTVRSGPSESNKWHQEMQRPFEVGSVQCGNLKRISVQNPIKSWGDDQIRRCPARPNPMGMKKNKIPQFDIGDPQKPSGFLELPVVNSKFCQFATPGGSKDRNRECLLNLQQWIKEVRPCSHQPYLRAGPYSQSLLAVPAYVPIAAEGHALRLARAVVPGLAHQHEEREEVRLFAPSTGSYPVPSKRLLYSAGTRRGRFLGQCTAPRTMRRPGTGCNNDGVISRQSPGNRWRGGA